MRLSSNKLLLLLSFVFFFLYSTIVHVFASSQYGPDNVDLDPTCAYTDPTCTVGQMEFKDEGTSITTEPLSIDFVGSGVALTEGLDGVLTVTIPGGGITIDSSTITAGAANQILFESAGNLVTEDADFTYNGFASGYLNVGTGYSIDGQFFATQIGNNIRIGEGSGNDSMTSFMNTFIGINSGINNTDGSTNVFIGNHSGSGTTSGDSNVFLGVQSGESNIVGDKNTFLGYYAGNFSYGSDNTFIGYRAGDANMTGSNNILIGNSIDVQNVAGDDQLSIGNLIFGTGVDGTGTTLSTGNIGIGIAVPLYRLDVAIASDGIVASFNDSDSGSCTVDPGDGDFSCSSDIRLKKNISDLESSLGIINSLRPVRYNWNSDENNDSTKIGFIAQEVDEVLPEFVTTYKDGYLGLNYAGFTPVLTKAIQELDLKITGIENFSDETFISRLREWLGSVTNGLEKLYAGKVETYEVQTDKLCVGSRCITESEFIELLDTNGIGDTEDSNEDQDEVLDGQENDENIPVEDLGDEESQETEEVTIEDEQEEVVEDNTEDIEEETTQEEGGQAESEIVQ